MNEQAHQVLVVDNDPVLLTAITTRLENAGFRCFTAQSGAQGVAELRENTFDLLITDLNMALGDGITLATAFRRHCDAPIVVMTGFVGPYAAALGQISNVIIVEKPFETHQLVNTVARALAHDRIGVAE